MPGHEPIQTGAAQGGNGGHQTRVDHREACQINGAILWQAMSMRRVNEMDDPGIFAPVDLDQTLRGLQKVREGP